MKEFRNKTAVITGAASGIGRALAEKFADAGMHIVLADVDAEGLRETALQVEKRDRKALVVICDVSDPESVDALADRAFNEFGEVHILCNNAGVLVGGASWELDLKDYQWLIGVNTFGVIHGIRSFVARMTAQGSPGHIVNTASMAALTTLPFAGAYHMSKHAVLAFSECLFHELALMAPKIGVSVLCPELIRTGIAESERCRPDAFAKPDESTLSASGEMVIKALAEGMAQGLDPSVMADRVFDGILENRFYILGEGGWRDACNKRLEDIREVRNPTFTVPS